MAAKLYKEGFVKIILSNTESTRDQIYKYKDIDSSLLSGTSSTSSYFLGNQGSIEICDFINAKNDEFYLDIENVINYINSIEPLLNIIGEEKFIGRLKHFKEAAAVICTKDSDYSIGYGDVSYPSKSDPRGYLRLRDPRAMDFRNIVVALLCDLIIYKKDNRNMIYPVIKENVLNKVLKEGTNETLEDNAMSRIDEIGYNKIYYGIPGCGKSWKIENVVLDGVDKTNNVFRTTFYLDYSNSDFIGQIYPKVKDGNVTYESIPGPFTKALARAYQNPNEMIYLVIEEINRGNAAAIFGDTFQLLDRLKKDNEKYLAGDSEYPITNEFIESYLKEQRIDISKKIYIPRNLTILATMNTSDQNVFPLDTAFKRRWDKERVVGNWKDCSFANKFIPYTEITWEKFATDINTTIVKNTENGIMTEDKKMGCFFGTEDMFTDEPNTKDSVKLARFVNNVVDYLFNDVSKFDHSVLFNKDLKSFDDIDEKVEEVKDETKKFVVLFNKQLGFVQVNVEQVEVVDNNE